MCISYSKEIDAKWQKNWEKSKIYGFHPDSPKEKLYLMEMFSYPSGAKLHIGHWWNFSLPDTWGKMKRMQGYEVFHPMGFDAFGLPAENYAIDTGIHPKMSTEQNIETMEKQLKTIGAAFDWDYEVKTCEPEYYKWTQWLFLQLYRRGLAYRKEAPVNWCPSCQTVLANEQAKDGECDRCGSKVIQKNLTQWFFKITDYAEELLQGLNSLDWPDKTKAIQRNWIGKSTGAEVVFEVDGCTDTITVYTTRVDTLMGVSYLVLAPENSMVPQITSAEQKAEVEEYQRVSSLLTELDRTSSAKEKTGVFTGAYAIHPITGSKIPIWISDYVIASYGTGAVMAVPAHDDRDYEFAIKYRLPICQVIEGNPGILIHSGKYSGLTSEEAMDVIVKDLSLKKQGRSRTNYRLRDWLVSRQRYWGAPIPVVYCEKCGAVPVPEEELPVILPEDVDFVPGGKSPLAEHEGFVQTTCPCCKGPARRETDTLDTFVCSSWYYLRYIDPHNNEAPWDVQKVGQLMPVDKYVGGIEHAAMHLLYARFIYKALRDMGYVEGSEPFRSLVHQGIILGPDGQKMSKSKKNTISPDGYIEKYGADVFRTYLAFGFSYQEGGPWSDNGIKAINSFFDKVSRMYESYLKRRKEKGMTVENLPAKNAETENTEIESTEIENAAAENIIFHEKLESIRHRTVKSVTQDLERFQFNTAVARLMEFRNAINEYQNKIEYQNKMEAPSAFELDTLITFLKLFAPFAPHFAEEIWEVLGRKDSIFDNDWPVYDGDKAEGKSIEIVIQINSKNRSRLVVSSQATEEEVKEEALACGEILREMTGKNILKVIYVKGKLINFVIR